MVQQRTLEEGGASISDPTKVKMTNWPQLVYQSTSVLPDENILFSLDGHFGLGQFQLRHTQAPETSQILKWSSIGECPSDCVSIIVEQGLPAELVFWIGLSTWFATLEEWPSGKISTMGFGVQTHVLQSLSKDFIENNQTIVQQIERDRMVFQPTLDIDCELNHEIFAEEVTGGAVSSAIADWLEEVGKSSSGRLHTSNLYFHADSVLHFSQIKDGDIYKLTLSMTDAFEDGASSVFSDYKLRCRSENPLWAKDLGAWYTLGLEGNDELGIRLLFAQHQAP